MKRSIIVIFLALLLAPAPLFAAPQERLVDQLIAIAEPDQIAAYHKLNLTESQEIQLADLAAGYAPHFRVAQGQPVKLVPLMTRALAEVDRVLTPAQRPLVRQMMPRPHQWAAIGRLRI